MMKVEGRNGELIDRYMALVDRSPSVDQHWWYNVGAMSGANVGVDFRGRRDDRQVAMRQLRQGLLAVVEAGMSEPFLVKALRDDMDEYFARRADTRKSDLQAEDFRRYLEELIADPVARAAWLERSAREGARSLTKMRS